MVAAQPIEAAGKGSVPAELIAVGGSPGHVDGPFGGFIFRHHGPGAVHQLLQPVAFARGQGAVVIVRFAVYHGQAGGGSFLRTDAHMGPLLEELPLLGARPKGEILVIAGLVAGDLGDGLQILQPGVVLLGGHGFQRHALNHRTGHGGVLRLEGQKAVIVHIAVFFVVDIISCELKEIAVIVKRKGEGSLIRPLEAVVIHPAGVEGHGASVQDLRLGGGLSVGGVGVQPFVGVSCCAFPDPYTAVMPGVLPLEVQPSAKGGGVLAGQGVLSRPADMDEGSIVAVVFAGAGGGILVGDVVVFPGLQVFDGLLADIDDLSLGECGGEAGGACFFGGVDGFRNGGFRAFRRFPGGGGQEAHRHEDDGDDAHQTDPEAGLAVVQDAHDPLLHIYFAESHGAGGVVGLIGGAVEQGGGIALPVLQLHEPDYPLVAGHLDIPAQQDITQPHQRIEPVDRQGDITQHLDPMVALFQVGPLMGQNVPPVFPGHSGGNVDFRLDKAQNKGSLNSGAFPAPGDLHSQPDLFLQLQVGL